MTAFKQFGIEDRFQIFPYKSAEDMLKLRLLTFRWWIFRILNERAEYEVLLVAITKIQVFFSYIFSFFSSFRRATLIHFKWRSIWDVAHSWMLSRKKLLFTSIFKCELFQRAKWPSDCEVDGRTVRWVDSRSGHSFR